MIAFRLSRSVIMLTVAVFTVAGTFRAGPAPLQKSLVWKLDNLSRIGGYPAQVLGNPSMMHPATSKAVFFDGVDDGFIIPVNPVEHCKSFTVEVRFQPASDGPAAPRFVHFEDSAGRRGTLELRVTPDGNWYADTFLKNGRTDRGLTLIDSTRLHPCGQWYWLALVYDGQQMRDYVNGQPELEGALHFDPMTQGQIALGVRLNRVNWFKGAISEIRFHPAALPASALQRK